MWVFLGPEAPGPTRTLPFSFCPGAPVVLALSETARVAELAARPSRRGVRLCTFLLLQPQPRGASWVPGALWVPPRPPTRWQSWPDCVKVACLFQLVVFIVKGSRGICEMFLEVEGMVPRASEGRGHHAWAALASSDTPAPRCRCAERAWSDRGQAGSTRCPQALPRELGDHV